MLSKKQIYNSLFLILFSLNLLSTDAHAEVLQCLAIFRSTPKVEFKIKSVGDVDQIKLSQQSLKQIKNVLDDLNLSSKSTKIKNIIEVVANHFDKMVIHKVGDIPAAIKKSDGMAEAGQKILSIVKSELNPEQFKTVQYVVAESVMRIESIKIEKFVKEAPKVFENSAENILHVDQFLDYVQHYVDGSRKYTTSFERVGLLDWQDIRHLYSNNSWIIGIKDHDMYHLHYSYGHPYYLAVNLLSSRSVNDRRYILISALWESVDNFRSRYENRVANYFQNKNMTAEEGMLELGTASEEMLTRFESEIGATDSMGYTDDVSYGSNWKPAKHKFGRATEFNSETDYVKEINSFINDSKRRTALPENAKYKKYHRLGPGQVVETSQENIP